MPGSDGGDITRCPHTSSPCQYWPASPLLMSQHCTLHTSLPLYPLLSHIVVVSSLGCDNISVEDRLQVTLEANTVQCYQLSASANVAPDSSAACVTTHSGMSQQDGDFNNNDCKLQIQEAYKFFHGGVLVHLKWKWTLYWADNKEIKVI